MSDTRVDAMSTAITEQLTPYADEQFLLLAPAPRTIDTLTRTFDTATLSHVDVVANETVLWTIRWNLLVTTRISAVIATVDLSLRVRP